MTTVLELECRLIILQVADGPGNLSPQGKWVCLLLLLLLLRVVCVVPVTASATKARKSRSVAWRSTSARSLGGGGPGGGPHGGRQGKIP